MKIKHLFRAKNTYQPEAMATCWLAALRREQQQIRRKMERCQFGRRAGPEVYSRDRIVNRTIKFLSNFKS